MMALVGLLTLSRPPSSVMRARSLQILRLCSPVRPAPTMLNTGLMNHIATVTVLLCVMLVLRLSLIDWSTTGLADELWLFTKALCCVTGESLTVLTVVVRWNLGDEPICLFFFIIVFILTAVTVLAFLVGGDVWILGQGWRAQVAF